MGNYWRNMWQTETNPTRKAQLAQRFGFNANTTANTNPGGATSQIPGTNLYPTAQTPGASGTTVSPNTGNVTNMGGATVTGGVSGAPGTGTTGTSPGTQVNSLINSYSTTPTTNVETPAGPSTISTAPNTTTTQPDIGTAPTTSPAPGATTPTTTAAQIKWPVPAGAQTFTDASGVTWYKTQGGNYRNTVTGATSATPPGAATTGGTAGTTTTTTDKTIRWPVPQGAETATDANGIVHYKTRGGNWRNTVTGEVSATPPAPAAATPAAPTTPDPRWYAPADAQYNLINEKWFLDAQSAAAKSGSQISPEDWVAHGEDIHFYSRLYGANAWWNPDGSLTEAGKAAGAKPVTVKTGEERAKEQGILNSLFPGANDAAQEEIEASKMFNWRYGRGKEELQHLLAAKGLSGSGAEDAAITKLFGQISAEEAQRITEIKQQEANRWLTYLDQEANRGERAGNTRWERLMNIFNLLASQNPATLGAGAAGAGASASTSMINGLMSALSRIASGGASSGGTAGMPSGADYSQSDKAAIEMGASNDAGWEKIFLSVLDGLF